MRIIMLLATESRLQRKLNPQDHDTKTRRTKPEQQRG